jgi:Cobalamin biosynthesis protein CbiG
VSLFRRNFLETAWRGIAVIHTGEVPPVVVRIKEALRRTATPVHIFSNRELEKAVRCYDAVVFAEALGGVVRLLCPLLRDKEVDPPVVVTDRLGRFFIPLIGAHRGANALGGGARLSAGRHRRGDHCCGGCGRVAAGGRGEAPPVQNG